MISNHVVIILFDTISFLPLTCHYISADIGKRGQCPCCLCYSFEELKKEKHILSILLGSLEGHCGWRSGDTQRQELLTMTLHSGWRRAKWWSKWRRTKGTSRAIKTVGMSRKKGARGGWKSDPKVYDLQMSKTSASKTDWAGWGCWLPVNQGHCRVEFMIGYKTSPWKIKHGKPTEKRVPGREEPLQREDTLPY